MAKFPHIGDACYWQEFSGGAGSAGNLACMNTFKISAAALLGYLAIARKCLHVLAMFLS